MNRFIVISTCYNVLPFVEINVVLNKYQSYSNKLFVYVDDNSTDGTYNTICKLTEKNDDFLVLKNNDNGSQAKAFMYAIEYLEKHKLIQDEDIIVEVDGDDWLSSPFVLSYLDQVYKQENIWMTYGQYQIWPTGVLGGHYNMKLTDYNETLSRSAPFAYSHLKTYKYWLFNRINRNDLKDPATGEYYTAAWDHVLCMPMVEMAGHERVYRCDDILYTLNRSEELNNEGKTRVGTQKETEQKIRNKQSYNRL